MAWRLPIPCSANVDTDTVSRNTNSSTERSLHSDVFADVTKILELTHVQLFASRLNFKVFTYASWQPGAKYFNAFYMSLCFSAFQCHHSLPTQNRQRPINCCTCRSHLQISNSPLSFSGLSPSQSNHLLMQPHNGALHPLCQTIKPDAL